MNLVNIFKATERIETALAAESTARAELVTAQARIAELEAAASSNPSAERIAELEGQITTLTTRAESAEGTATTQAARIAELEASAAAEPERINAALAAELAKLGHAPVSTTGGKKDEPKSAGEGLTGLAKSIAIHKAQKSTK